VCVELVQVSAVVEWGGGLAVANAVGRLWGDTAAGERGRARVRELCSPGVVAEGRERIYAQATSAAP
jgi:hypothetical protein